MYNNQNNIKTPATFLKTLTIIYAALLIGQLLFVIVVFSITNSTVINLQPSGDVFFYLVPIFTIGCGLLGAFLYKQQIAKLMDNSLLAEKLAAYQTAFILRCAPTEGASLFGIVIYMNTGNLFYLIIAGFNILYFILMRPTKDKLKEALNLTYEEEIAMEG